LLCSSGIRSLQTQGDSPTTIKRLGQNQHGIGIATAKRRVYRIAVNSDNGNASYSCKLFTGLIDNSTASTAAWSDDTKDRIAGAVIEHKVEQCHNKQWGDKEQRKGAMVAEELAQDANRECEDAAGLAGDALC